MKTLSLRLLEHANALAKEIAAKAVVIYADALESEDDVRDVLATITCPTILFTRARQTPIPRAAALTA